MIIVVIIMYLKTKKKHKNNKITNYYEPYYSVIVFVSKMEYAKL